MSDHTLQPGDRFQLKPDAVFNIRRRGARTGRLIRDDGDEWKLVYDGTATVRSIHKSYIQAESQS